MKLSDFVCTRQWAIQPEALEALRQSDMQVDAAHSSPAHSWEGGDFTRSGATAVIGLRGVIMQDATYLSSLISVVFGGTVLENFKDSLAAAMADPAITNIVIDVNSPGGEAFGIEEAAAAIRDASATKPVTAFVDGMAASAAYWLASAADRIVLSGESSQVGSIGVVLSMLDTRGLESSMGVKRHEIVSAQSPKKRPDPATAEGQSDLQAWVNQFADVFVSNVAKFRGKTADQVISSFGQGGMVFAAQAVDAGMADSILSRSALFAELAGNAQQKPIGGASAKNSKGASMSQDAVKPAADAAALEQARADAKVQERQRINAILTSKSAEGRTTLANHLAMNTDLTPEAAEAILAASPVAASAPAATAKNPLIEAMEKTPNPKVPPSGDTSSEVTAAGLVNEILAISGHGKKVA